MREARKAWKLELTNAELTILQIALQRFADSYEGDVFTKDEIESTKDEVNTYKYIAQFTSKEDIIDQSI